MFAKDDPRRAAFVAVFGEAKVQEAERAAAEAWKTTIIIRADGSTEPVPEGWDDERDLANNHRDPNPIVGFGVAPVKH